MSKYQKEYYLDILYLEALRLKRIQLSLEPKVIVIRMVNDARKGCCLVLIKVLFLNPKLHVNALISTAWSTVFTNSENSLQ